MPEETAPSDRKESPRGAERRVEGKPFFTREDRRIANGDRRHEKNHQYSTFVLDGHFFGVEVLRVQEVLTVQEMTRVPLAPPVIAGLINLRGQIVTAIDLRIRLGFNSRPKNQLGINLVVQTPDGPASFLVDQIGDVIEVYQDLFEPPPEILDPVLASVVEGVYKLKDRLLLILNIEAIIQVDKKKAQSNNDP